MFDSLSCLGLSILGTCQYDPAKPYWVYFSIGEGIATLAILLALQQLIDTPIAKFRMTIKRHRWPNITHIMFVLALIFIFTAAILPLIPGEAIPVFGYPIFWEILAGLSFSWAILKFYFSIKKPVVFDKNNYKAYAEQSFEIIAGGNKRALKELATEISNSISPLFKTITTCEQQGEVTEEATYAISILKQAWSDKKFCKIIVTYNYVTLCKIFYYAKQNIQLSSSATSAIKYLTNQLICESLSNSDSILSRENDKAGLGYHKNATNEIFADYSFITSAFRPLDAFNFEADMVTEHQIKNYFSALSISLNSCIKSQEFKRDLNPFINPFDEKIFFLTWLLANKLSQIPVNEVDGSLVYKLLIEISKGFVSIIELLKTSHDAQIDIDPITYDYLDDNSICGVVARGIFRFFEGLSACATHDLNIRVIAITCWLKVTHTNNLRMHNRVTFHLLKKVSDNLNRRHYPLVTRLLINLEGVDKLIESPEAIESFSNQFKMLLISQFRELFEIDSEFAISCLPDGVSYDRETNRLIQKTSAGIGTLNLN